MAYVASISDPPLDPRLNDAWVKALGGAGRDRLQRRLAWDNVSVHDVIDGLQSEPGDDHRVDGRFIEDILRQADPIGPETREAGRQELPFVDLWDRVASGAMASLAECLPADVTVAYQVQEHGWGEYSDLRAGLAGTLTAKLSTLAYPTLWEEFNKRRTADQVLFAFIKQSSDPSGRPLCEIYCTFLEDLRRDGLRSLFAEYPVLKRHLRTAVANWQKSTSEILTRVHEDRALLHEHFGVHRAARLVSATQGQGDSHRGGRTVSLLTFADGSGPSVPIRVVYKPRDVGLDQTFQSLLAQLSPPSAEDRPLRSLRVIRRDGYGYMEHVEHRICADDRELRGFYRNAGRLSAVLHLLGCSDCHHENLIACGDQLCLIDAETLFEGIPTGSRPGGGSSAFQLSRLQREIAVSVLKLGILPHCEVVGADQMPIDASALGIQPPPIACHEVAGWVALNSDGMFLGRAERQARLPTSLPVNFGGPNRLSDFADDYCDGLRAQLAQIADEKRAWGSADGLLSGFKDFKRRYVNRATWIYGSLQQRQLEPASLRTEMHQRLVLESLARKYLSFETRPVDWPLFAAEVSAMDELDIPLFEQAVDERGLRALGVGHLLEASGFETACSKLERLDPEQVKFQVDLARGTITAKQLGIDHGLQRGSERQPSEHPPSDVLDAEERWTELQEIGDAIVGNSITDGQEAVEWLGVHLAEDSQHSIYGPLGTSLYDGKMGIALFLASLGQQSGSAGEVYSLAASRACSELKTLIMSGAPADLARFWRDQPLGIAGSGGVILASLHLRSLMPALREMLDDGLSKLVNALDPGRIVADEELDVLKGCAGLVGPLLKIGSARARFLAEEAGRRLIDRQDRSGGWLLPKISAAALTGFSHGASGMAAALARLHSVTSDRAYRDSAERALAYERATFDAEHRNWPDFRGHEVPADPRFMLSWCHGAPGIALSRLCLMNTPLWDEAARNELVCAAETTSELKADGDSICCGRFGRSAILRLASTRCSNEPWMRAAIRLDNQGLSMKRVNGGYGFSEMLGLFRGASGVGLTILDSVSENRDGLLPSILSAGLTD